MKNIIIKSISILALLFSVSCEDYLDKAPESTLTEEEVFEDFDHAQGFVDEMYALVVDYGQAIHWESDYLLGDDAICNTQFLASRHIDRGDLGWWLDSKFHYFSGTGRAQDPSHDWPFMRLGIWDGSLKGIRKANLAIDNIDKMVDATQAEKDVILGQAYFFRAFFHFEIMKFWGRFPYIDKVLEDEFKIPRPENIKEPALAANEDFKRAAELLPVDWDEKNYGEKTLGNNMSRLTKGAAYAFQGKNLLFAASPLMKGSEDTYDYDTELCNMAVDAFAEVLKLDDQGVYDLLPFDRYEEAFWDVPSSNQWPGSTEFIFTGMSSADWLPRIRFVNIAVDQKVSGGTPTLMSPTHNFIHNNFGMANGLSIEDDLSGEYGESVYDRTQPFENRDPRFYKWIIIDGDRLSDKELTGDNAKHMFAELHTGGAHRSQTTGSQTGYFYKKYYPTYYTQWDNGRVEEAMPWRIRMRLTDVYLMYAEALHAATGSATATPDSYNLSAEDVVNIMRDRAGIPHVHPSIVGDANKFMDELRRERSVELSFEGHRWVDIRRWVLAHRDEYKIKTGLEFPEDHSYFNEVVLLERVCEYPKHYWLPLETSQTQLYEGFPQNPGW